MKLTQQLAAFTIGFRDGADGRSPLRTGSVGPALRDAYLDGVASGRLAVERAYRRATRAGRGVAVPTKDEAMAAVFGSQPAPVGEWLRPRSDDTTYGEQAAIRDAGQVAVFGVVAPRRPLNAEERTFVSVSVGSKSVAVLRGSAAHSLLVDLGHDSLVLYDSNLDVRERCRVVVDVERRKLERKK